MLREPRIRRLEDLKQTRDDAKMQIRASENEPTSLRFQRIALRIDLSHNDVKRGKPDVTRGLMGFAKSTSQSSFAYKHQAFHV